MLREENVFHSWRQKFLWAEEHLLLSSAFLHAGKGATALGVAQEFDFFFYFFFKWNKEMGISQKKKLLFSILWLLLPKSLAQLRTDEVFAI